MPPTRREFLSQAAMTAAIAGFGPRVVSAFGTQSKRPYLDLALRCARWIDASTQTTSAGVTWPADPAKPAAGGLDYYNGAPGVVCFFAQLAHATGDAKWRDRAHKGGQHLVAESAKRIDQIGDGLYTGLAGLAATYMTLDALKVDESWHEKARGATSLLASRAKTIGNGAEWQDSNDIISGTAGIGLFLLHAASAMNDRALGDLAARAGRRLLKTGQPAEGGLMWFPGSTVNRNYPNFSHGTSGVSYFLATLHQRSGDREFLDGALSGAKYLDAVATRRNGARAIFHVTGGGENRFYLSWCHGPVGTARLFYRLTEITKDAQWRQWVSELNAWVVASGAPEQQSDGYWNNISQCCGNVGIGQYCIDLARKGLEPDFAKLRERVVTNTMSRATDDERGLRWAQAENRVSPEAVIAQTGFMQGAAGVGTFFLQLDALSRNQKWLAPWPDTPWV